MAVLAAFELATPPAQPESIGIVVANNFVPVAVAVTVLAFLPFVRAPDAGAGVAF